MSSRRKFFKQSALAGLGSFMIPSALNARDLPQQVQQSKKRALRIAHITDVHILDQKNAETCFARVISEINAMKDKPDLIINTGDSVMDENEQTRETVETRWKVWNKITASNKIPMMSCLGNHDVWYGPTPELDAEYKKDKRYGKQWAMEMLKLPHRYYSFEKAGWKFIGLDSINGKVGYSLDEEQFAWLDTELKNTPAAQPIMVFSHVPLMSVCATMYKIEREEAATSIFPVGDQHTDTKQIKSLFHKYGKVKACLSGHVHYIDRVEYLGVKYMCNGAVSGNWWRDPLVLDEFAPVYSILDLYTDGTSDHQLFNYNTNV